ncbi:MAG: glutamate racemase [Bacilli bacterium]|nr:glutamate racemase [Bacilli bacterium]
MNCKIGIFDSGIGGFSILGELKRVLPNENFLYYKDSKNNPYGEKTEQELFHITSAIVEYLKIRGCRIIVIACNTATTRCIKKLRMVYPELIFVGTVPAIKIACDGGFQNTIIMATPSTIESERISELIKGNKKESQKFYLLPCKGLAHLIELQKQEQIESLLLKLFSPYQNKKIDSIILGCTHYSLIKKEISKIFCHATLIDGTKGVAQEVKHQMKLNNLEMARNKQEIKVVTSKI